MAGRGLQDMPIRIPPQWERVLPGFTEWFQTLVRDVFAKADIRNSIEGSGITITGQSDELATLSASEDVLDLINQNYVLTGPSTFLPNERILTGAPGTIEVLDGGPGGNVTINIKAHAVGPSKLRRSFEWSVMGNPTAATDEVRDIIAANEGDILRLTDDVLEFVPEDNHLIPAELIYAGVRF